MKRDTSVIGSFAPFAHRRHGLPFTLATLTALLGFGLFSNVQAEDWAQFRGPNCSGISSSKNLPVNFSADNNVSWSHELGDGIACPIIVNDRVYITSMVGDQTFAVICFDALTGEQLWKNEMVTGPLPGITPPNSHASSTPAADGERVYVYFSTLGLLAFSKDGKLEWHRPLPVPEYLLSWGAATSPVLYKDSVIFCQDDDLFSYVMAVNKKTGEVLWQTERSDVLGGYAVPLVCPVGDRAEIVVAGSGHLKGYDSETGKELWRCNSLLRTVMTTPVFHDGIVYLAIESYGDTDRILKYALLQWRDTNQDGAITKDEVPEAFTQKFVRGDVNKDGKLVDDEITAAFQPTNTVGGGKVVQAVRVGGSGDVTESHMVWNLTDTRAPSNLASPLFVNDRLFIVKKGGISSSFDTNGKKVWYQKRIGNRGNYYASPVAGDGKIYVPGENGNIVVLEDGPEMKVLAKNDMGGSLVATPAIANDRIFVRTRDKLLCVGEQVD